MLGGKAWREYARALLTRSMGEEDAHRILDKLTYFIAQRIPCKAV
jgi:hypothetical protein